MGILDRLFGGRFVLPPPDETTLSDAAIRRELRADTSEQKQALKELLYILLGAVPADESARLHRRIMRKYALNNDPYLAISEGLLSGNRGQKQEYLVLLCCDWKGFDVFEYQAPLLVEASGVNEPYSYRHDGTSTMPEVLEAFDRWLRPFGKRYLHIDSGSDSYEGVVIDIGKSERISELAQLACLKIGFQAF